MLAVTGQVFAVGDAGPGVSTLQNADAGAVDVTISLTKLGRYASAVRSLACRLRKRLKYSQIREDCRSEGPEVHGDELIAGQ